MTDKIKEILSKTKYSFSLEINSHKDVYQSVKEHFEERKVYIYDEIDPFILEKMIELDTIIYIIVYPTTPIGSYRVHHYDLESALDTILQALNNN